MRAVAFVALGALLLISLPVDSEAKELKKPLCDMCVTVIGTVKKAIDDGEDVPAAVEKFCNEEVPEVLSGMCVKLVAKNLKFIIEKLKIHETPEDICSSLSL
ncbi:unnamed protein product [Auanema sp. JU1783]|nr:unnamed protein product [Auanema sp. JU1783]